MFSKMGASRASGARSVVLGMLLGLSLAAIALPAGAQDAPPDSPSLSVGDRLEDRRYVATGPQGVRRGDGRWAVPGDGVPRVWGDGRRVDAPTRGEQTLVVKTSG
jgi:hypothetical protein